MLVPAARSSSDQVWVRSPAGWLVLGVLGLLGLQITPLPASWLAVLSPRVYEILPLWAPRSDGAATIGLWKTLSLTPVASRDGFVVVMAFALLFLTVIQRVRQPGDVERLLRWIALATLIMAVFALVQFFCGNGKFFWFYEHPYTTTSDAVKGSFSNRNHFADFMALGIGPWMWWIYTTWRRAGPGTAVRCSSDWLAASFGRKPTRSGARIGLLAVGLAVIVFAGVLSLSRGGTAAMLAAALACLLIVHRVKRINRKMLLALVGTAALTAACLLVYGYQSVAARLEDFSSVDQLDREHGRRKIWAADLKAMADFPAAGTGLGSHADVYPRYLPEDESTQFQEYTHAENGYLQIGLETGIPGLLLLGITIGLCVWWCVPAFRAVRHGADRALLCRRRSRPGRQCRSLGGRFRLVCPGLHGDAGHLGCLRLPLAANGRSAVRAQRNSSLPAVRCTARVQQVGPCTHGRRQKRARLHLPRSGWITVAIALLGIGVMSATESSAGPSGRAFLESIPADRRDFGPLGSTHGLANPAIDGRGPDRGRPRSARPRPAHLQLAAVHLRMFDCAAESSAMAMDVRQVRDAVSASHFKSVAARDEWLSRAFGARRGHLDAAAWHARRALASCPLQGEAYLYLAELSFLDGPSAPDKAACIDQALLVRPFDGAILFAAGQEAALDGDSSRAWQLWRASFQAGSTHQERLINALAGLIPAATLIDMLQPGLAGLERIVAYYRQHPSGDNLLVTLERMPRRGARGPCQDGQTSRRGLDSMPPMPIVDRAALGARGRHAEAIRCLREAVRCDPLDFDARLLLGSRLLESKDYGEAVTTLQWCLQQNPRDRTAQRDLERAMDGQLRSKAPK